MPVYTVHAPVASDLRDETDKFVFVRDGFHFWAMVFGGLWLVWHRLWLVLLGYIAFGLVVGIALMLLNAPADVRTLVFLLIAVLMGFEAASLRRWSYSRGHWQQIDFVVADDEEAAERRFFDRWADHGGAESTSTRHIPPVSPVPPPVPPAPRTSADTPQGIIGLFPEPGGSR